ncbi:hypothetical protein D3C86_2161480 [compost metagenome]
MLPQTKYATGPARSRATLSGTSNSTREREKPSRPTNALTMAGMQAALLLVATPSANGSRMAFITSRAPTPAR